MGTLVTSLINPMLTSSKQSDYQLLALDSGIYFHNDKATQDVKFTLPLFPADGLTYTFTVTAPFAIKVQAAGGATFSCGARTSTVNGMLWSPVFGSSATIYSKMVSSKPYWFIPALTGQWEID